MSNARQFNLIDRLLTEVDHGLRTVFCRTPSWRRANPAEKDNYELSRDERKLSSSLIRVDHCGEICAQALYRGQALFARDQETREHLHEAAREEQDHLAWCDLRLKQLYAHTSYLNPIWYGASFAIGALSGAMGDRWSLGFVIATETQVEAHIEDHLQRLPKADNASRTILMQMQQDEAEHAQHARDAGGTTLPKPIQWIMTLQSKVMTTTAYYC